MYWLLIYNLIFIIPYIWIWVTIILKYSKQFIFKLFILFLNNIFEFIIH